MIYSFIQNIYCFLRFRKTNIRRVLFSLTKKKSKITYNNTQYKVAILQHKTINITVNVVYEIIRIYYIGL